MSKADLFMSLNDISLLLLSVSSVILLAKALGFIDYVPYLSRYIEKKEKEKVLILLDKLGLKTQIQAALSASAIKIPSKAFDEIGLKKMIAKSIISERILVGKINPTESDNYWNVIGHSCDPNNAYRYAQFAAAKWKKVLLQNEAKNAKIDFIVTPKNGSPLVGYELSKLLNVPFVLYSDEQKFSLLDGRNIFEGKFDASYLPPSGATALIFDDSTTGGRKVIALATDIRNFGYQVNDCLVLFEPMGKKPSARESLAAVNVELHRVIEKK